MEEGGWESLDIGSVGVERGDECLDTPTNEVQWNLSYTDPMGPRLVRISEAVHFKWRVHEISI